MKLNKNIYKTALIISIRQSYYEIVQLLLKHPKIDINIVTIFFNLIEFKLLF